MPDMNDQLALVNAFNFAALVSHGPDGFIATHLPLRIEYGESGDPALIGHMARANPHVRLLDGKTEALAIFQGEHGYISPRYYVNDRLAPAWNYSSVYVEGRPAAVTDEAETRRVLDELTAAMEGMRPAPWSADELELDFMRAQMKGLVVFRMLVTRIEGKRKLSQNRKPADQAAAIAALDARGRAGDAALAADMRRALGVKEGT